MSIVDTHWDDHQCSKFSEDCLGEAKELAGLPMTSVRVSTFFLSRGMDNVAARQHVLSELKKILPKSLYNQLPGNAVDTFLGLGDLAYVNDSRLHIVLSRPDPHDTLADRIHRKTGISLDDIDARFCSMPSSGIDNLELMNRLHQVYMCLMNGGMARLEVEDINFIKYRSMLGARRLYLAQGGDHETMILHAAASHIGAFTQGKIAYEYMGYMRDMLCPDSLVQDVYRGILDELVDKGRTTKDDQSYASLTVENLAAGFSALHDKHTNCGANERVALAFYQCVVRGEGSRADFGVFDKFTPRRLVEVAQYNVVDSVLCGFAHIMGENLGRYIPARSVGCAKQFQHVLAP